MVYRASEREEKVEKVEKVKKAEEAQLHAEAEKVEKERDSASGHRGITRSNRFAELKIVDETREVRSPREA